MKNNQCLRIAPAALLTLSALFSACSPAIKNTDNHLEGSVGGPAQDPKQIFQTIRPMMHGRIKQFGQLGRVKIDLADDQQFQFIQARLQAAGITEATAPNLFSKLKAAKTKAAAAKQAKSTGDSSTQSPGERPRCDVFVVTQELSRRTFKTLTRSSCVGGSVYTYVDTYLYDGDHNVLAHNFKENWADGVVVDLEMSAPPPAAKTVYADAITYQETKDTLEAYYDLTSPFTNHLGGASPSASLSASAKTTDTATAVDNAATGTLTAPVDLSSPADGVIKYCLARDQNASDCDYRHGNSTCNGNNICDKNNLLFQVSPSPFQSGLLYMPMSGNTAPVVRDTPQNPFAVKEAYAWLTLKGAGSNSPAGGLCTTDLTGAGFIQVVPAADKPGFARVVINPMAPSLGNANWSDYCVDNGKEVDLHIQVTLYQPNCTAPVCVTPAFHWTTAPTPMQIWWGCLAAGTPITLADGTQVPIESIALGQKVLSDEHGRTLTVVDITQGAERKPMVRIVDNRGNIVTMTATHAMPIGDGRVIQAQALAVGDRIGTKDGSAVVVSVERPEYESAVYNLTLGTPEERAEAGLSGTTMFAGGIRVGDGRMQGLLTERARADELKARGKDIPAEKRVDYQFSLERMRRQAQSGQQGN